MSALEGKADIYSRRSLSDTGLGHLPPALYVPGMGVSCCGDESRFEGLSPDYKRRLWLVIAINAAMFFVEMGAGALAGSRALQADALDFFGDTLTYGMSLAVSAPLCGFDLGPPS